MRSIIQYPVSMSYQLELISVAVSLAACMILFELAPGKYCFIKAKIPAIIPAL